MWRLSPQVAPLTVEEEDKVKEIEREESRPQAIRILRKRGDEVVVVEEEDTTREVKRLRSTLSTVMKQIEVSIVSVVSVSHPILHSKTKYSYMCAQDVQTHTYITNCNSIKVKYLLHCISHHNVNT